MKRDWKIFLSIWLLIVLVVWLIVISLNKSQEVNRAVQQIKELQQRIPAQLAPPTIPIDGKTPVLGIDYSNGTQGPKGDSIQGPQGSTGAQGSSAYDIAVQNGFVGTQTQWLASLRGDKGDKGDSADTEKIQCLAGLVAHKPSTDDFWLMTNIKCETVHD